VQNHIEDTKETAGYNSMGGAGSPLHATAVSFPPAAARTEWRALLEVMRMR